MPHLTEEERRRLCLWLLDQCRQNLPIVDRELAQDLYPVENVLQEKRPIDPYTKDELLRYRFLTPTGMYLYEGRLVLPQMTDKPAFQGQQILHIPSYSNQSLYLNLELEGIKTPL